MKRALVLALATLPVVAQAHPGAHHVTGFTAGSIHPLMGLDHLLAMIAVGLWAAQLGGRAVWAVPASFVGLMSFGALLGMNGIALPGVETGIVGSALLLGVLIATAVRLPVLASAALVGVFALCHGQAHAAEIPAGAGFASYVAGFVFATALLHGIGVGMGLIGRNAVALRLSGAAIAVCAVLLASGLL